MSPGGDNALGQLAVAVDFKGQSNRFVYDVLGRVATNLFYAAGATVAGRTNTFEYEPGGRYQRFIRPEGTTEIDRNVDGAVTNILAAEGCITYEHDAAAGWLKRAYTTNSDVRYDYDGLARLKTVSVYKRNGTNLPSPEMTTNTYTQLGSLENVKEPHTPTKARGMPMNLNAGTASRLRTLHASKQRSIE